MQMTTPAPNSPLTAPAIAAGRLTALAEEWGRIVETDAVADPGLRRSGATAIASALAVLRAHDPRAARATLAALRSNVSASQGRGITFEAAGVMLAGIAEVCRALGG
jgi:hypothetical protein